MIQLKVLKLLPLGLAILASAASHGQSIYVDIDVVIGGPAIGAGAPSSTFGAAAGTPGVWNAIPIGSQPLVTLLDIAGLPTSATYTSTGDGGGVGFLNPTNTGDFALLLNDANNVGNGVSSLYTISGLTPGEYRVFTYAVAPQGDTASTFITVSGTSSAGTQEVTGPMPGNQLILGVTHSMHDVFVAGTLTIKAEGAFPTSYVNGFQIVAVPEPSTCALLFTGLAMIARHRRKPRIT